MSLPFEQAEQDFNISSVSSDETHKEKMDRKKEERESKSLLSQLIELFQLDELPEYFIVPKRISFKLGEFCQHQTVIELSPKQYQRYFRADIDWQQQFMKSFFVSDVIIPEIALRFGKYIPVGDVETMDGCQRMSTAVIFINNDVCLPDDDDLEFVQIPGQDHTEDLRGKYYRQLSVAAREYLLSYELTSQVYYNLTPERAGHIFVNILNNQNALVNQEKRQAISSAMSRWVQETARFGPIQDSEEKKQSKSVFEVIEGLPSHLKHFKKGKEGQHIKLNVDQCLAEIIFMTMSDSYITQGVSSGQITKFYKKQAESYQDNFDSTHVEKVLTFVNQSMRGVPKAKTLTLRAFRNYCVMISQMLKAKVSVNPIDFMNCYLKAIDNLSDKKLVPADLTKTPYQALMSGSKASDTNGVFKLLWKEMSLISYKRIKLEDRRDFTRKETEDAYWAQKQICPLCEYEMPEFGPDIHGDHILLYKDGNPTTPDNCDAVHSSCNWRK